VINESLNLPVTI